MKEILLEEAKKRYPIGCIFESAYDTGKKGAYRGKLYGIGGYKSEINGMTNIIWALDKFGHTCGWLHRDNIWAPIIQEQLNYSIY